MKDNDDFNFFLTDEFVKENELTTEKENEQINFIRERKQKKQEQEQNELNERLKLIEQEKENILSIQSDIKLKYENNELNLTDEQKKKNETKRKQETKIIEIETEYIELYKNWEEFKKWKIERFKEKTRKEYSRSSMNNINSSFKYLLGFIDNNEKYNIKNLNSRFFVELQEQLRKIPSDFQKKNEFKNKTLLEIIEINSKLNYSTLSNKYINDMFDIYIEFFKYLNNKFIFENDIFKNYVKLVKQQTDNEYERFTEEEIKLLFNNNLVKRDKETIKDFIKIGLYSGLRIGELSELRKKDIIEIDGIYCFNVIEDLENNKRLKNKSSVRIIPIHSEILEMVLKRQKTSKTDFLIFDGSKINNNDRINKYYIRKLFPKNLSKVFHSTRKNFTNRLEKYEEHHRVIQLLLGHSINDMTVYYSGGSSEVSTIEKRKQVLELLKYDL